MVEDSGSEFVVKTSRSRRMANIVDAEEESKDGEKRQAVVD